MPLSADTVLPPGIKGPGYDPARAGTGIVHFGPGAFHRAHQAACTDAALTRSSGDWRILGVSLQSTAVADALSEQDGRYTLVTRPGPGSTPHLQVIGSIAGALAAVRCTDGVLAALQNPATRIVSMTVTEKAYGLDRATGRLDPGHPAVRDDLVRPDTPTGLAGLITEGLRRRRAANTGPFTVLCCDNLPDNGSMVRNVILDFARRTDASLADWIAEHVTFPATMVDRITPAPTADLRAEVADLLGSADNAAVETEPFTQWVIEDRFCAGRPDWEAGGALFVSDVAPFENMKLRMLNGAHSLIAYTGVLCGFPFVRDAIGNPQLRAVVRRHMQAAAATLDPIGGFDFDGYADDLMQRFANPQIAHKTAQIAMDGSQKMPQRIFAPALAAKTRGLDITPFATATAVWLRYTAGLTPDGQRYEVQDPRSDELRGLHAGGADARGITARLAALPGLLPEGLSGDPGWNDAVAQKLAPMLQGDAAAILDAVSG
ncbi:mannitol dehydrogenase family protein [Roseobacter ponti]|uniref:Mannitol dehydrogenase family protein n=1 Tax=Roseobacter ponti TaxID=1891787 RepID=A0A858SUA6_9RHOB|nr:mannitol dehydrogenase family protein [Roseobacter ponti]QJF52539.1 mannitol dehydrogenase family protein [Roseobacter ponti]